MLLLILFCASVSRMHPQVSDKPERAKGSMLRITLDTMKGFERGE